ncbi:MAG: hypothetical protein IPH08_10380 [Rhodocyclaceae bacterium]|nr:hypothetical protein [Rhodocyclaceae bacterium]
MRSQASFSASDVIPPLTGVPIALIGMSGDEQLWHSRWSIGDTRDPPVNIPRPNYVLNTQNGLMLKSFFDEDIRQANGSDLAFYGYRHSKSGIGFTHAMQHIHNICACTYDYSRITYNHVVARCAQLPPGDAV